MDTCSNICCRWARFSGGPFGASSTQSVPLCVLSRSLEPEHCHCHDRVQFAYSARARTGIGPSVEFIYFIAALWNVSFLLLRKNFSCIFLYPLLVMQPLLAFPTLISSRKMSQKIQLFSEFQFALSNSPI